MLMWILTLTILGIAPSVLSDQASDCATITDEDAVALVTCCKYVPPFTNETIKKCENETGSTLPNKYECYQECLFSSDGVLGEDKQVDKKAWKELIEKTVTAKEWKDIIATSVDHCELHDKTMGSGMNKTCPTNRSAENFFNCMALQMFLKCPDSAWNSEIRVMLVPNRFSGGEHDKLIKTREKRVH